MENHHFEWVNQRTKWPFSIAMFVYQRVNHLFLNMRPLGRQKVTQKNQPCISSSLAFHLSWFSHVLSLCFLVFNVSVLLLAIIIPNAHGLVLLGGFNPSEKYESQMGKIKKHMSQTTNQRWFPQTACLSCFLMQDSE